MHVALCEEVLQLFEYAPSASVGSYRGVLMREEPAEDEVASESEGIASQKELEKDDDVDTSAMGDGEISDDKPPIQTPDTAQGMETKTIESSKLNNYPSCWFEDEASGEPLRWQLFVGVLYDAINGKAKLQHSSRAGYTNEAKATNLLPWRIRVHFTAYPTTLIPLGIHNTVSEENPPVDSQHSYITEISSTIGRIFRNSLKQALFMQYSSSKVAMSITKSSHEKIWDAVVSTNYTAYHEVDGTLKMGSSSVSGTSTVKTNDSSDVPVLIPVRVMLNSDSPMQKPCRTFQNSTTETNETSDEKPNDEPEKDRTIDNLVEHLATQSIRPQTKLGDILTSWLPQYFVKEPPSNEIIAKLSVEYYIQGIQPSLSCPILDLWRSLCHPDHFLYVVVVTKSD